VSSLASTCSGTAVTSGDSSAAVRGTCTTVAACAVLPRVVLVGEHDCSGRRATFRAYRRRDRPMRRQCVAAQPVGGRAPTADQRSTRCRASPAPQHTSTCSSIPFRLPRPSSPSGCLRPAEVPYSFSVLELAGLWPLIRPSLHALRRSPSRTGPGGCSSATHRAPAFAGLLKSATVRRTAVRPRRPPITSNGVRAGQRRLGWWCRRSTERRQSCPGGLRLRVGRRDPRQHPAGGGQAVPAGADRSARTAARVHHARGRLPGVHRVLG